MSACCPSLGTLLESFFKSSDGKKSQTDKKKAPTTEPTRIHGVIIPETDRQFRLIWTATRSLRVGGYSIAGTVSYAWAEPLEISEKTAKEVADGIQSRMDAETIPAIYKHIEKECARRSRDAWSEDSAPGSALPANVIKRLIMEDALDLVSAVHGDTWDKTQNVFTLNPDAFVIFAPTQV